MQADVLLDRNEGKEKTFTHRLIRKSLKSLQKNLAWTLEIIASQKKTLLGITIVAPHTTL